MFKTISLLCPSSLVGVGVLVMKHEQLRVEGGGWCEDTHKLDIVHWEYASDPGVDAHNGWFSGWWGICCYVMNLVALGDAIIHVGR